MWLELSWGGMGLKARSSELHYRPHPEQAGNKARKEAGRRTTSWLLPLKRVASQSLGRMGRRSFGPCARL